MFLPADRHVVGAHVLRDAAGFALGDAGLANGVEQARLAVVDVTHDGDDGGARHDVPRAGRAVAGLDELFLEAAHLDVGAELAGEHRSPSRCRASS